METQKIPSPGALPLATQHSKCDFAPLFVVGAAAGAETCSPWMLKYLIHISLLLTNKVQSGSERHRKAPSTGLAQGTSEVQNCPGADIAPPDQPHALKFSFSPPPSISIHIFPLLFTSACSGSPEERWGHCRLALYSLHQGADLIKINLIVSLNLFTKMCVLSPSKVEFSPCIYWISTL